MSTASFAQSRSKATSTRPTLAPRYSHLNFFIFIARCLSIPEQCFDVHGTWGCFVHSSGRAPHVTPHTYPCSRRESRARIYDSRIAPMIVRTQGGRLSLAPTAVSPSAHYYPSFGSGAHRPPERGPEADSDSKPTFTTKTVVHLDNNFCRGHCIELSTFIHCATAVTKHVTATCKEMSRRLTVLCLEFSSIVKAVLV